MQLFFIQQELSLESLIKDKDGSRFYNGSGDLLFFCENYTREHFCCDNKKKKIKKNDYFFALFIWTTSVCCFSKHINFHNKESDTLCLAIQGNHIGDRFLLSDQIQNPILDPRLEIILFSTKTLSVL